MYDGLDLIADKEKWGGGLAIVEFKAQTTKKIHRRDNFINTAFREAMLKYECLDKLSVGNSVEAVKAASDMRLL